MLLCSKGIEKKKWHIEAEIQSERGDGSFGIFSENIHFMFSRIECETNQDAIVWISNKFK